MGAKSIRDMLAAEAVEAEAIAEAENRGERKPAPGQRARQGAKDPSQVYSVRIPVDRIEQLRSLAAQMDVAPTVLLRRFVLERLDVEAAPTTTTVELPARDPNEVRLGPSRSAPLADVVPMRQRAAR